MMGNRPVRWSDCGSIFGLLQRVLQTPPHSVDMPWLCIWQVVSAVPSCTSPVIGGGVHLAQQPVLPCKLFLPHSGFLNQGILKGSTCRDVWGLTQYLQLWSLGVPSFLPLHGGCIMEQVFQHEHAPFLLLGSSPN